MKSVITIEELQSELLDLLERLTNLIEKAEIVAKRPARPGTWTIPQQPDPGPRPAPVPMTPAQVPDSTPGKTAQKPSDKHPWRATMVRVIGIGEKPAVPAALPECPCVNPTKEDCAKLVPPGIHTRGTGAAAQYSRCRMHAVRLAVDNRRKLGFNGPRGEVKKPEPKSQLYGHLCDAKCGRRTSNRFRICATCRHSGQGGAVASSAAS